MQLTLTPKQQRVLDHLQHEITNNGQAPSKTNRSQVEDIEKKRCH